MLHLAQKLSMCTQSSMHLSLPCIWKLDLSKGFHFSMTIGSHQESLLGSHQTNTRRINYNSQLRAIHSIFSGSGISTASFYKLYSTSLGYLHPLPPLFFSWRVKWSKTSVWISNRTKRMISAQMTSFAAQHTKTLAKIFSSTFFFLTSLTWWPSPTYFPSSSHLNTEEYWSLN